MLRVALLAFDNSTVNPVVLPSLAVKLFTCTAQLPNAAFDPDEDSPTTTVGSVEYGVVKVTLFSVREFAETFDADTTPCWKNFDVRIS